MDRAIDRAGVERIVRQVVLEYLGREKDGAGTAAPAASSSASAAQSGAAPGRAPNARLFTTPEAEAIKKEICAVGRKLWLRQFVDGNGGNISYRIGPNEVLCTPTLVSKYDLTPEDICMVDLEGNQIAGTKPRTSELLLHLEIYKAVPEAKAVVHCHPPHATAYAITGRVPPNLVISEFEILVGKVAIAPYETPGTPAFARVRAALREAAQYGAAGQPRHRLLVRYGDARRMVCRGAGNVLLDADAGRAARRSHLAHL